MATYIVLCHFTEQGIRGVKDSPKRAAAFKAAAKKAGVTVKAFYWTLGRYDMVSILEAPSTETVTALGLKPKVEAKEHTTDGMIAGMLKAAKG